MADFNSYTSPWSTGETKENLSYKLELIAQMETPVYSSIGRGKTSSTRVQWIEDTIAAAAKNGHEEGSAFASDTLATDGTTRQDAYTQIFRKDVEVTGTEQNVDAVTYQGKRRMAEQLALRGMELKRDIEFAIIARDTETNKPGAGAGQAGSSDSQVRGIKDFWNQISTDTTEASVGNVSTGSTFEDAINNVAEKLYEQGGLSYNMGNAFVKNANMMVMAPSIKKTLDSVLDEKNNVRRDLGGMGSILGVSYTKYGSSFGDFAVVPDVQCDTAQVAFFNPQNWKWVSLRETQKVDVAKVGDADRAMLIHEGTLIHRNTKASGKMTGVTTS